MAAATTGAGLRGLQLHDLGRTNATPLVLGGVDAKTARTRLGHSDIRLTLSHYVQQTTEADHRAADLLAETLMPANSQIVCDVRALTSERPQGKSV